MPLKSKKPVTSKIEESRGTCFELTNARLRLIDRLITQGSIRVKKSKLIARYRIQSEKKTVTVYL